MWALEKCLFHRKKLYSFRNYKNKYKLTSPEIITKDDYKAVQTKKYWVKWKDPKIRWSFPLPSCISNIQSFAAITFFF